MKFSLTNFNENDLKNDLKNQEIIQSLFQIREIFAEIKSIPQDEIERSEKIEANEQKLKELMQNLVKQHFTSLYRITIAHAKDIFNNAVEMLEKSIESGNTDEIILILSFLGTFLASNFITDKPDNTNLANNLALTHESVKVQILAIKLSVFLGNKRQPDIQERSMNLAQAPNLLRSSENHQTLYDIASQQLANSQTETHDLVFEIEQVSQGLNERSSSNIVVIKIQDLLESNKPIKEIAKSLAIKYQQDKESFIHKLETKIQWLKYLYQEKNPNEAVKIMLDALNYSQQHQIAELRNQNSINQYLSDKFANEAIHLITNSCDEVNLSHLLTLYQMLVLKTLTTIIHIFLKSQGPNFQTDPFVKPMPPGPDQMDDENPKSFLAKLMEDLASIQIQESSEGLPVKVAKTKTINSLIMAQDIIQYYSVYLANCILKTMYAHHNRPVQFYQDLTNMLAKNLLQIISTTPDERMIYTYNLLVQQQIAQILKMILRPRMDEQHEIVSKITTRLIFELDNLNSTFYMLKQDEKTQEIEQKERQLIIKSLLLTLSDLTSRDYQNLEIGRRVSETKILQSLQKVVGFNNDQQGHLIDDFFSRSISSGIPAQIPAMIRNGIIPDLIKSLEQRIPYSADIIDAIIYGINQISIHEEGQKLISESPIFDLTLKHAVNDKLGMPFDQQVLRLYLANLFDRTPALKDIARDNVNHYLQIINQFANEKAKIFIQIFRNQALTDLQKYEEAKKNSKIDTKILSALTMIYNLSYLSNENMAQNRHSQDIMNEQVTYQIIQTYLRIIQIPLLSEMQSHFEKTIKTLVEVQIHPLNVRSFQNIITDNLVRLKSLFNGKIYHLNKFDFSVVDQSAQLKDLNEFELDQIDDFLTLGEKQLFQLNKFQHLVKTTHFLHTSTFHLIIQNKEITKFAKMAFYLKRISLKNRTATFMDQMQDFQQGVDLSEEEEKYKNELLTQFKEETQAGKLPNINQMRTYFSSFINSKVFANSFFKVNVKVLDDFLNKFCSQAFVQRQNTQKEALEQCLLFIGKLVYLNTQQVNAKVLSKISVEPTFEFARDLHDVCYYLAEISSNIDHGLTDGAAFYMFFKKGGVNNLIECFQWLSQVNHKIDNNFLKVHIFLFDELCLQMKSILEKLISSRTNDNSMNSILTTNMGSVFDNAKNLYQTFYHTVCAKLLQLDSSPQENLVLKLQHPRNSVLQEIVVNILQNASRSFSHCALLKESNRAERDQQNRRGGRGQNQADPQKVAQLISMGFMFSNEKIQQALVQTQNNIDSAVQLLLQWQQEENNQVDDPHEYFDNEYSSGESNNFDDDQISSFLEADALVKEKFIAKQQKVQKVNDTAFQDILKRAQQEGFKWIIEAQGTQETLLGKFREYILHSMINEKNEATQKWMFAEIDRLFKLGLETLYTRLSELQNTKKEPVAQEGEDQIIQDIDTTEKNQKLYDSLQSSIEMTLNNMNLICRLINCNKQYLKEAVLKSDFFNKVLQILENLTKVYNSPATEQFICDDLFNMCYQRLILESLVTLFSIVQLNQLKVALYLSQKTQVEQFQKKAQAYLYRVPLNELFKSILRLLQDYQAQVATMENTDKKLYIYRNPIIMAAASIGLKILQQKEHSNFSKTDLAQQLFLQISQIKYPKVIKSDIIYGVTINHFENQKLLQNQMEKLSSRVLWLKSEYEHKLEEQNSKRQAHQSKDKEPLLSHLKGMAGFNNFLKYFQTLQIKDQATFKQVIKDNFEVQTVKKLNQVSQDQATINFKEAKFNEIKKLIQKERSLMKQATKQIDFKNDKQVKTQLKQAQKSLLSIVNEQQCGAIQTFISQISTRTTNFLDLVTQFNQAQAKNEPLVVEKAKLQFSCPEEDARYIELLFKLSLTYPAVTVPIMQAQPLPKRSFANWFIKDFLVSQMINMIQRNQGEDANQLEQAEVNFQIKPIEKLQERLLFKAVNQLTSYNHLMTANEQIVKHEIRTKFLLEALQILQKSIRDKNQNQILQKCQIISSLIVIESLINFQSPLLIKNQVLAKDNFHNSIRVAIMRESVNKDSNLPVSFIKLADELVGDLVDVTLESNADIVSKVISILNCLAEYINIKRKKEEKKEAKHLSESEARRELIAFQEEFKEEQMILGAGGEHEIIQRDNNPNYDPQVEPDQEGNVFPPQRRMIIGGMEDDEDDYGEDDSDGDDDIEDDDDDDEAIANDEEDDDNEEGQQFMNEDEELDENNEDEEDIYDDDEEVDIAFPNQDGGQPDIFVDDEDMEDAEDQAEQIIHIERIVRQPGGAAAAAGQRQLDIINPVDVQVLQQNRHGARPFGGAYRFQDLNAEPVRRNPNWTDEEADVQRILTNLRGSPGIIAGAQSIVERDANINRIMGAVNLVHDGLGNMINPWAGADPLGGGGVPPGPGAAVQATSMIEQLYEELKTISDADLLALVNTQKAVLETEFKNERMIREKKTLSDLQSQGLLQVRGEINALHRRLEDFDNILIDFAHVDPVRLQMRDIDDRPDLQIVGGNANAMLDPMFARPNLGWENPFQRLGHPHQIPRNRLERAYAYGARQGALDQQLEFPLFHHLIRNQNQINTNQNDDLGHQLLEVMDVQVQEQVLQPPSSSSADLLQQSRLLNLSSPRLINEGFDNLISGEGAGLDDNLLLNPLQIHEQNAASRLLQSLWRESENIQNVLGEQERQIQELNQNSAVQSDVLMQSEVQQEQSQLVNNQALEIIQAFDANVELQPVQDQINLINISDSPASLQQINNEQNALAENEHNEQMQIESEEQKSSQQEQRQEEAKVQEEAKIQEQQVEEEEKKEESQANDVENLNAGNDDNKTFGYDNDLLIENGIDPMILLELPEDLRAELLSTIDIQPAGSQQQQQQQPAQSNNNSSAQQQNLNQLEEQKQPEQQQQPGGGSGVNDIANELGLDPEFLANLPEDMQLELIQNEQFRQRNLGGQASQQPPAREAEGMDLASFIASVVDPSLRREIFINMDESVIATLPPNLMAEARQFQSQVRNERGRFIDVLENVDRLRGLMGRQEPHYRLQDDMDDGGFGAIFGRRAPGQGREEQKQPPSVGGKTLEEAVTTRHQQLFEELYSSDDVAQSLITQLSTDEKILEQLLLILVSNSKIECSMIPCLQNLIKIHSNGLPVIRNKIINAITFLLKSLAVNDDQGLKALFPNTQLNKKKSALILIGCLRLLLKNNRSLMKFILKGLIQKEDNLQHLRSNQILKKQQKYLKQKGLAQSSTVDQQMPLEVSSLEDQIMQQTQQQLIKQKSTSVIQAMPPLAEIFYLIRTEMFKNDKALLRNLSMLIHQILKQFDIALEELESSNQTISSETVQSIAEVLSLDIIDQTLMNDLGEFLFLISKKKRENFNLISSYCLERSQSLLETLTQKLTNVIYTFNEMKNRISPGKQLSLIDNYSPSQGGDSVYEEEKNEMMIDTTTHQLPNPLQELKGTTQSLKNAYIKLQDEDEKLLKQQLKLSDVSEVLLRIFKLFNLFYQKFSLEKDSKVKKSGEIEMQKDAAAVEANEMIIYIKNIYEHEKMSHFVQRVNEVLRIIYKANIDVTESVSNLMFCVFEIFNPEMYESIMNEQKDQKLEQAQPSTESNKLGKYQVKMLTLDESQTRQSRQILFRNQNYFTNRIQELSNFCLCNKRLINKLIKSKSQMFTNEVEALIKQMPNLLDFDNKRIYFKRELQKLKKAQYAEQIQLFIRRDNIFMDSYVQLGNRQPSEMKGRLHIQFTGERGQDAGGLTRDFFIELSREMFNPNYSLFLLSSSGSTYYPNPQSGIEKDHLRYFKFIGRVIGKSLFDECLLECYFVKTLYKIMTGEPLMFQDLEDFDNEFYNNLKWCINNDIETLYQTFVVEQSHFGRTQEIELIKDGAKIPVTNENKNLYIEQLTYFKLYKSIQQQIDSFLEGFYELIPKDLISIFNHKELELLISGLPNFDLNDLKQNTEYMGYNAQSSQILWLWEILETFENSERAEFLQFVTGSSKVPLDGFKGLMGMRGPQKFTVAKIKSDDMLRLPSGHTCFNQIDIPEYPSKEIMHERLLTAIKETKGFGFA
ncbi:ubiquitin-protein ligase [Stylonychia lemnae]|uniref:HECT-type E3 ubiquitin transferase n=1 Tax=Stylonychia lemnae TaxID=5949 RepID=A0A078A2F6_STYLE|nr:ubiquitin-protein ligase [Stylonychia lemnae]|eukprot:CDW76386.1 ubiquitin-protein ligase [Stylonychia lemnae]